MKILGLYRITPTKESIIKAARYHKYDGWLLDDHGEYVDEVYWDNFENLGLLEIQIHGDFKPGDLLADISHEDQVPYLEFYLDSAGSQLLSENGAINTESRHVCFFLHFVDPAKSLCIAKENFSLPHWSELPKRLEPFTHYLPVD